MSKRFKTYLIKFEKGGYLYTGSTGNLSRRLRAHLKILEASKIYYESFETREEALAREKQIKGWTRAKKEALVAGDIGRLRELARGRSRK